MSAQSVKQAKVSWNCIKINKAYNQNPLITKKTSSRNNFSLFNSYLYLISIFFFTNVHPQPSVVLVQPYLKHLLRVLWFPEWLALQPVCAVDSPQHVCLRWCCSDAYKQPSSDNFLCSLSMISALKGPSNTFILFGFAPSGCKKHQRSPASPLPWHHASKTKTRSSGQGLYHMPARFNFSRVC